MDVCLHRLPVIFVIDRAGVTGPDGPSHHGIFDLSYLRLMPNLAVCAPADAMELCALFETALHHDGPVAIRFPKGVAPPTPDLPAEPLPVGRWEETRRGDDIAILAVGRMLEPALAAAARLDEMGMSCAVINARWVKPLDPRLLDWARRFRALVPAEDNVISGGFGAAVMEALAPHGLAGKVRTAALPDGFLPHGKPADLLAARGLDAAGLVELAQEALAATRSV
jgi:1-deoxy-D-xylulose-5-phosphate synthase